MKLLQVAVDAYNQYIIHNDWEYGEDEPPMRAVLRALADEIGSKHQALSGHQIAMLLEAAGAEPPPDIPEPHPSLSAQERNPNLR